MNLSASQFVNFIATTWNQFESTLHLFTGHCLSTMKLLLGYFIVRECKPRDTKINRFGSLLNMHASILTDLKSVCFVYKHYSRLRSIAIIYKINGYNRIFLYTRILAYGNNHPCFSIPNQAIL